MSAFPAPEPRPARPVETPTPDERPAGAGLVPVRLPVLGASATARTPLAAFHRALVAVGLGHYNLVRLSSVIPPGTEVGRGRRAQGPALPARWRGHRPDELVDGFHGDRLYCVYAEHGTAVPGEQVWAGVGWTQRVDGQGGYFVEHHGATAEAVRDEIRASLADMTGAEAGAFEAPEWVLEGVRCEDAPVCALVVVPYAVTAW